MSAPEHLTSIRLEETLGVPREREPVRIGIPLPRGALLESAQCSVVGQRGETVPHQCRALAFWPDRSIKWLLVDALASVGPKGRGGLALHRGGADGSAVFQGLTLRRSGESIFVGTGVAEFRVDLKSVGALSSAKVETGELLEAAGMALRLRTPDGIERLPVIRRVAVEESGSVRATICLEGDFTQGELRLSLDLRWRLSFFAGSALVRQEILVRNPRAAAHPGGVWDLGDRCSFLFADLSLALNCRGSVREVAWSSEAIGPAGTGSWTDLVIHQDSSGGDNWDSPNHVDAGGQLTVRRRGFSVTASSQRGPAVLAAGERASPFMQASTDFGWMAVAVQDFWQNFPKALRVEGNVVSVGLFPRESASGFELQGGEQKRHLVWLEFGVSGQRPALSGLQVPLAVSLDPDWVEHSRAIPWLVSAAHDGSTRCREYVQGIIDGQHSFFVKRERVDEYGWRNFGDLYADHEAVHHRGAKPMVSHYNNQYDFVFGALSQFLRTGDGRWRALMEDAARHTIDIDIYHTAQDRAAYNGGLFWHTDHYKDAATCGHRTYSRRNGSSSYGGGPSNEHNYTSGLLHHHYLTGDPEAAAAVRELADWVVAMDDGARNLLGLADSGPTGLASRTVDDAYHGPGRGAGNSINALLDAYRLTGERHYLAKAEELIQRCIHPADDIAARKLDEPEYRWSYLVFLQILGKYLDAKQELGESDYAFYYARESLLHYARWMLANEVPYKDVLHKVLIPTETWPAHDIRKCHVFHLAAMWSVRDERESFAERAGYFFERCLDDLFSFETAHLTRPLVILSVYGHTHPYYCRHGMGAGHDWRHNHSFGQPSNFLPQSARAKDELRRKLGVAMADVARRVRDKAWDLGRRFSRPG